MKNLYLLLFILLITSCNKSETEKGYSDIEVYRHYPHYSEPRLIEELDTLDSFKYKLYTINSTNELIKSPLFKYCPKDLKDTLSKCDFENQTLFLTGSYEFYKLMDIKSSLGYDNSLSEYIYKQTLLCESNPVTPFNKVYLIIDALSIKKIKDRNVKYYFGKEIGLTNK